MTERDYSVRATNFTDLGRDPSGDVVGTTRDGRYVSSSSEPLPRGYDDFSSVGIENAGFEVEPRKQKRNSRPLPEKF